MCNNCDYVLALYALVSLYTQCFELAMRQVCSLSVGLVAISPPSFIVNSTSDCVMFEYILCSTASVSSVPLLSGCCVSLALELLFRLCFLFRTKRLWRETLPHMSVCQEQSPCKTSPTIAKKSTTSTQLRIAKDFHLDRATGQRLKRHMRDGAVGPYLESFHGL
jgi:hypothetical protein